MFEQTRLLELAGLGADEKDSNLLTESACAEGDEECTESAASDNDDDTGDEVETLEEIRVRNFIRNEIRSMLKGMNPADRRSWILRGQHASTNSRPGHVSRGFTGPGFVN
jgi:hypothetical protein